METKVNADPWLSAVRDFIVSAFLHKMSFHAMEYLHQVDGLVLYLVEPN